MDTINVRFISQISKKNGQYITVVQIPKCGSEQIRLDYFDDMISGISISNEDAMTLANDILKKVSVE